MTTRDYLSQLRTIDYEIAMSESEAQSWRDLAMKLHHEPSDVRVDTSPAPDKTENLVVKAADCAIKAAKEREILIYTKVTIEKQIKAIEDKDMRFMLWGYYHDRKSLKELAKRLSYSYPHAKRQMKKATDEFEGIFGMNYL